MKMHIPAKEMRGQFLSKARRWRVWSFEGLQLNEPLRCRFCQTKFWTTRHSFGNLPSLGSLSSFGEFQSGKSYREEALLPAAKFFGSQHVALVDGLCPKCNRVTWQMSLGGGSLFMPFCCHARKSSPSFAGEMIADEPDKPKPEKTLVTFEGESEANRIVQERLRLLRAELSCMLSCGHPRPLAGMCFRV